MALSKDDPRYGTPVEGSKTEARGLAAHQVGKAFIIKSLT